MSAPRPLGAVAASELVESGSLYLKALATEVKRLATSNLGMRLKAAGEIGHIAFHGGDAVQTVSTRVGGLFRI
ncbi:hypothetical protein HDU93_008804 [Gonapodya sp. JEL0774]|nr:hypothetical protein HDU93_008804 [Gonapodya sp. JEL0774]